jgi:hypothetical protein
VFGFILLALAGVLLALGGWRLYVWATESYRQYLWVKEKELPPEEEIRAAEEKVKQAEERYAQQHNLSAQMASEKAKLARDLLVDKKKEHLDQARTLELAMAIPALAFGLMAGWFGVWLLRQRPQGS